MKDHSIYTPSVINSILVEFRDVPRWVSNLSQYGEIISATKGDKEFIFFESAANFTRNLYNYLIDLAKEIASQQLMLQCWPEATIRASRETVKVDASRLIYKIQSFQEVLPLTNALLLMAKEELIDSSYNLNRIATGIKRMHLQMLAFADEVLRLHFRQAYCAYGLNEKSLIHSNDERFIFDFTLSEYIKANEVTLADLAQLPDGLHPDSCHLVINTANAMAEKLYRSQEKYGYTNGWRVPAEGEETGDGRNFWTREECLKALFHHLEKGDPIDCINYLAFMQANGWRTELPAQEHANE
ncbi:hypothetical protein LSE82_001207 [Salmonella enterica]|nr:hypothetical protein [Salmonella enterica]